MACAKGCSGGCTATCANSCSINCTGGCTADGCTSCKRGCTGGCINDCSKFCSYGCSVYCSGDCSDNCAGDCTKNCTGNCTEACDNGCSGSSNDLIINYILSDIIMANEIQDISDYIKNEVTRRGKTPTNINFNIGDVATVTSMNNILSNLALANQTLKLNDDNLIDKDFGNNLIQKTKDAYNEILVP